MSEKNKSIYLRVTPQEKEKIRRLAKKCGLSLSEYLLKYYKEDPLFLNNTVDSPAAPATL